MLKLYFYNFLPIMMILQLTLKNIDQNILSEYRLFKRMSFKTSNPWVWNEPNIQREIWVTNPKLKFKKLNTRDR